MTVTITRELAVETPINLARLAIEVGAAIGGNCYGRSLEPGIDGLGNPDPTKTRLMLDFDDPPNEVTVDAAIAAYPALPANVGSQFAAQANVTEHVAIVSLDPGEHVGLRVTLAVSLAGPPSKDGIVRALVPVWREPGGTVEIGQPLHDASSRIVGVALNFAVQQLDGADVGVAVSFSQRASGTVRVLHLEVTELYRKVLP